MLTQVKTVSSNFATVIVFMLNRKVRRSRTQPCTDFLITLCNTLRWRKTTSTTSCGFHPCVSWLESFWRNLGSQKYEHKQATRVADLLPFCSTAYNLKPWGKSDWHNITRICMLSCHVWTAQDCPTGTYNDTNLSPGRPRDFHWNVTYQDAI